MNKMCANVHRAHGSEKAVKMLNQIDAELMTKTPPHVCML